MVLMQGNEACLRGAIAAGMRFYAGYPITPSTEIAEQASELLPKIGGHFIQMEDEISSMAAIIGASAVGVKAMTATSGPGFSLMQENIGLAAMTEMPCVVVDVQRAGPSTGMATNPAQGDVMQARWGTHGDHPVIALAPGTVQEAFDFTVRAFNLSERYRVPVIFLMDELVGHLREGVRVPQPGEYEVVDRALPDKADTDWLPYRGDPETLVPVIPPFAMGWRYHVTGLTHDERGYPTSSPAEAQKLVERLMRKIELGRADIVQLDEFLTDDAETLVVCYGGTVRAAKKAVRDAREAGIRAGLFRAVTLWPFPGAELAARAKGAKRVLVVEHNYGQIVREVQRELAGVCPVDFLGTVSGAPIEPETILEKLREVTA